MKVMILKGPGRMEPGTVDRPALADDEVLIRVSHSGICGTDLEISHGGIPVNYPRVMGHEMIGEVVDGSPKRPTTGTRVIVDPVVFCGACYQCRAGQRNLCPSGGLIGRDRRRRFRRSYFRSGSQRLFPARRSRQ
jgi:threonine dehydrogenase-like Zn-dependent dehydrogenase